MIDLHIHTNYSDGTWDLTSVLTEAEKIKLEVLSITDHDTLKAYEKLSSLEYKKIYTGKILPGIELNTIYNGIKFELLAYGFQVNKLKEWVEKNYENKLPDLNLEFKLMYNNCKLHNIKLGKIDYDETKGWPVDILHAEIKKYEENKQHFTDNEWDDVNVFYNACITNKEFPAYVDFSIHYPTAQDVASAVRKAGGKLFVAHIFRYNLDDEITFLQQLLNNNIIDGIEVYHSSFTKEEIDTLEKYCKENNLLMSGGTDFHGDKKVNRKLGVGYGNMNISKEILNKWNIESTWL